MCNTWQNPSRRAEEFDPAILEKLPGGMERLNITGGEPLLRNDIEDIVRILDKKTKRLEISTNGYFYDRIIKLCEKFPHLTIRVSLEGLPGLNDQLRGIKDGFDRGLRTILRLKEMGQGASDFAWLFQTGIVLTYWTFITFAPVWELSLAALPCTTPSTFINMTTASRIPRRWCGR